MDFMRQVVYVREGLEVKMSLMATWRYTYTSIGRV